MEDNYLSKLIAALDPQPPRKNAIAEALSPKAAFGSRPTSASGAYGLFGGLAQADAKKIAAWQKAKPAGSAVAMLEGDFRLDDYGNLIRWEDYGKASSIYGWEVDHAQPSALGGSDHHSNLRALSCKTNRSLGGLLGNALGNLKR